MMTSLRQEHPESSSQRLAHNQLGLRLKTFTSRSNRLTTMMVVRIHVVNDSCEMQNKRYDSKLIGVDALSRLK